MMANMFTCYEGRPCRNEEHFWNLVEPTHTNCTLVPNTNRLVQLHVFVVCFSFLWGNNSKNQKIFSLAFFMVFSFAKKKKKSKKSKNIFSFIFNGPFSLIQKTFFSLLIFLDIWNLSIMVFSGGIWPTLSSSSGLMPMPLIFEIFPSRSDSLSLFHLNCSLSCLAVTIRRTQR